MDTTGCPEGYATDIAFQPRTATDPCTVPLAAYYSALSFLIILRFVAAVRQTISWHNLNVKLERKRRKPVAVSLSFSVVVLQIITTLCIGFNVINVYNGLSWMMYSLTMLPYMIQTSFVLLRFVSLGERIIPLGRQLGVHSEDENRRSLRRFSKGGRFLAFWQFISAIASSVTLVILSPIDPSHQDLHATIGLAFKAQFMLTATAGGVYQLYRCVLVVKKMQRNMEEVHLVSSKQALAKTKTSIQTMQKRMLLAWVMGVPSALQFALLAFHVLPRDIWWADFYPSATEAIFAAAIEFLALPRRGRRGLQSSKETSGGDPAKGTVSGGNKVEPGTTKMSSSALVAAPRLASEYGTDADEGSKSYGVQPAD